MHAMSQMRYGTFLRADDWLLVEGVHVTLFFSSHLFDPKRALVNLTDTCDRHHYKFQELIIAQ